MLLRIKGASKEFSGEYLFQNVDFEIKNNEKIAIIGRNGCGKTTFLKMINGTIPVDEGERYINNNVTVGTLSQTAFCDESLTVREEFDKLYQHVLDIERQMNETAELLKTDFSQQLLDKYSQLQIEYEVLDGYNYNQQQLTLFTKFGFSLNDLDRELSTFSGGQKTRIAFVKLLLTKPDILLLDEPTNHLDMNTIEWLEGYLKKYPKAIILVSHDRMFLDKIVDEVCEFEFGRLTHYTGNYTSFVQQKKVAFERQQIAYRNQQMEIKRLEEVIEKFRYKKNKAAFAQSKIKYLEHMERIEKPREDNAAFKLKFEQNVRGGNMVLAVENLVIGYDKPLCKVSFQIKNATKLAVIGPNGYGKSTLVKTLMGQVKPLAGEYMYGHQIEVAYFDQQLAQLESSKTVLDELWDMYPDYDHTTIRKVLGSFLFSADDVFKTCNVLSGGEKVRLLLAKIMLSKANLLILDEPTNHLDIAGKEALENALLDYQGTVIFVSHDRYFINKLATNVLYIEDDKTKYYQLNYQEFLEKQQGKEVVENKKVETKTTAEKPAVRDSRTERENAKKAASLERKIDKAEQELEALRALRFEEEYYHDYQKMNALNEQIDEKHNEIENLMKEWEQYAS